MNEMFLSEIKNEEDLKKWVKRKIDSGNTMEDICKMFDTAVEWLKEKIPDIEKIFEKVLLDIFDKKELKEFSFIYDNTFEFIIKAKNEIDAMDYLLEGVIHKIIIISDLDDNKIEFKD